MRAMDDRPHFFPLTDDTPLVTVGHVRELLRRRAEHEGRSAEYRRLACNEDAAAKKIDEQISALAPLMPNDVDFDELLDDGLVEVKVDKSATKSTPMKNKRHGLTWIKCIENILLDAGEGMTHQQLLAEVKKTELAEKAKRSDKGFYGAIARLHERQKLIKAGGLLFAKDVADKLERRGELPKENQQGTLQPRPNSASAYVIQALEDNPNGMTGPELKSYVSRKPNAPDSVHQHGQYIYNVLSKLMDGGRVRKTGSRYVLTVREGGTGAAPNNSGAEANASFWAR